MSLLHDLIAAMGKEEVRLFKLYATRTAGGGPDRKDLRLFDALRRNPNEEAAFADLYAPAPTTGDKNSYYNLKHSLTERLLHHRLSYFFRRHEANLPLNLLALARISFAEGRFEAALELARRAEKKAVAEDDYESLDLIYAFHIRLTRELPSGDPRQYVRLRRENARRLRRLRELDDLLAELNYELKLSQNFAGGEGLVKARQLMRIAQQALQDETMAENAAFRLKAYHAAARILLQNRDYEALAHLSADTYEALEREKLFDRNNHADKLQMLSYRINALFKVNRYEDSLAAADLLCQNLDLHDGFLRDRFLFFYYNSLVINWSVLDLDRAIALLEELEQTGTLKHQPFNEIFLYLNLGTLNHDKGRNKQAVRWLNKLFAHENYPNAAPGLRFRIAVVEAMLRYEIGDYDLAERALKKIRKEFRDWMRDRDRDFLRLLGQLARLNGLLPSRHPVRTALKSFLDATPPDGTDEEIVKYDNWLRKRL